MLMHPDNQVYRFKLGQLCRIRGIIFRILVPGQRPRIKWVESRRAAEGYIC